MKVINNLIWTQLHSPNSLCKSLGDQLGDGVDFNIWNVTMVSIRDYLSNIIISVNHDIRLDCSGKCHSHNRQIQLDETN